ncbi:DUF2059 domain-containing protein [Maridesulfovibrio sp.]|uniref:DUF2059 domain-containing protein n=1 Tax=Maridesulfovibrio sp. TaxID=2795000 RepID=UPI0029CA3FD3|nr:DUF2059 domain-containing protein [Maridesulfovibrio sp.]
MKLLKTLLICTLIALPLTHSTESHAKDNERLKIAYEMAEITYDPSQFGQAWDVLAPAMLEGVFKADPKTKKYGNALTKLFADSLRETFNEKKNQQIMKSVFARVYAAEFNKKELMDIIAFYKTDTGKKCIKRLPVVMSRAQQEVVLVMDQIIGNEFEKNLKANMEIMKKNGTLPADFKL